MKIAVNTRLLLKDRLEGIGRFSYETLKRCVLNHPEHEFHFIFDRQFDETFIFADNVVPHVIPPQSRHPFLWYAWFEWSIPLLLKRIKPDCFLSTDGYLSLNTNIPSHLTIHDIAFEHYPDAVPFWVKKYYRHYVPKFAAQANRIVTVSEFTKQDVHQHYQIPLDKMDVVHNGVSDYFIPIASAEKQHIKNELTNGEDFFICVSSLHPRKNIEGLLLAFDLFKKQTSSTIKLVLVGDFMFGKSTIQATYKLLKAKDDIVFTGSLSHQKIAALVAASKAMVYVSLFEGFGIPIVEAMRCEVPVITSNVNSMAEVAADAALTVDPTNHQAIADAMQCVMQQPELINKLIQKGKSRQALFSWDTTAINYWKSVEQIL